MTLSDTVEVLGSCIIVYQPRCMHHTRAKVSYINAARLMQSRYAAVEDTAIAIQIPVQVPSSLPETTCFVRDIPQYAGTVFIEATHPCFKFATTSAVTLRSLT